MTRILASLTWKLRQQGTWLTASDVMPAESASRIACTLLREFAGKPRFTPRDFDVTGDAVKHSSYVSDEITVRVRRIKERA